ncbi:MAG: hypothetical protein WBK51_02810 [Polaromonas sp.]
MKKISVTAFVTLSLALAWASSAKAMDIEARPPFVILSGNVTGIELRMLKDAIDNNPSITTVVLKDSRGGDARTGYAVGEYIREKGLSTAVSGFCRSSCSRMFLGGKTRNFSDDQPLDKTYVAFHGNYSNDGKLIKASAHRLKAWIATHSDGKANPELVEQWVNIEIPNGFAYFYHPQASVPASTQRVLLCQGSEDPKTRLQQCAKPELGDALANGILTTLEIVKMNPATEKGKP